MTNVDDVLEQCLTDILTGASTPEGCLARYPEHAAQLEPLLRTAARVELGSRVRPSPAFKARTRAKLTMHMQAYPRKSVGFRFPVARLATGLATILLTLFVTGTVYAQGVLPGDPFYGWKLTSERVWRFVSPNSVSTDFAIANRRIDEINATANDPKRRAEALDGYREVKERLASELDDETLNQIMPSVDAVEESETLTPTPIPTLTLTPVPTITMTPTFNGEDNNGNGNGNEKDNENGSDNGNGKDNGNGNSNNNGNGNDKDPKPTHPVVPTKRPKLIPTIVIPPSIK